MIIKKDKFKENVLSVEQSQLFLPVSILIRNRHVPSHQAHWDQYSNPIGGSHHSFTWEGGVWIA